MSVDLSYQMFFPFDGALEALEALGSLLRRPKGRPGVEIIVPGEGSVELPARPDPILNPDATGPMTLAAKAELPTLLAEVACLAATSRKGRLHAVSHGASELIRKGDKTYAIIPFDLSIARGDEYVAIAIGSTISPVVTAMMSRAFRTRIARFMGDAGCVAAAGYGMGEWSAFAEDGPAFEVPDDRDFMSNGPGAIDDFVAFLHDALG